MNPSSMPVMTPIGDPPPLPPGFAGGESPVARALEQMKDAAANKELAGLAQGLAVQLAETRRQRDLWESMHRNQCAVNEPLHQLAADQRELIEGLRVQVNQFERLLGMIPCTGDFDKACAWVQARTADGRNGTDRTHGTHTAESLCVAEVLGVHHLALWCSNCNEKVCEGEAAPGQSIQQWSVDHELAWENHCAGARPRGEKTGGTPAPQFPNGRFASQEKGGV